MKKILIITIGIIMCSGYADAQNLLNQLGKMVLRSGGIQHGAYSVRCVKDIEGQRLK